MSYLVNNLATALAVGGRVTEALAVIEVRRRAYVLVLLACLSADVCRGPRKHRHQPLTWRFWCTSESTSSMAS